MRMHLDLTLAVAAIAIAMVGACAPGSVAVVTGESSTSSTSSTSADTSTGDPAPELMRFAALSVLDERLCAITLEDGRVVCRDAAQCDIGRDPADWDLEDPACWIPTALPDTAYVQLMVQFDGVCAIRSDDRTIECDGDYFAPPAGSGFIDFESQVDLCATDGETLKCTSFRTSDALPGVAALDGFLALTSTGILDTYSASAGCAAPECYVLVGEFVDVFGAHDYYYSGCGLRTDGTLACTDDLGPIVDDRPIAQVEFSADGSRCLRFETGEVECSFGHEPAVDDLVALEISSKPVPYACGIRSDGAMVCWGEAFPWCGPDFCVGEFECFDEQCFDCTEGCEPCGDTACTGLESCVDGECSFCSNPPCTSCGDEVCESVEQCLGDQCFYCGDRPCPACGDTYCDAYHACVEDLCVARCNDTTECADGEACIDDGCVEFGLPECENPPPFVASALPLPIEVRGTPLAFADDDSVDLLVAGPMGAWVVAGPELADATQIIAHDGDARLRPAVGDFDGDGDIDIALANLDTASVTVFDNDGAWTPLLSSALPTADNGDLVAADADGDGLADLFFGYDGGARDGGSSWHRNLGGGMGFVQEVDDSAEVVAVAAAAADLDRDGRTDFAICDASRAKVLAPATGNFYFALLPDAFEPTSPSRAVAVGDFDGDGALGIALVQHGEGAVWIDAWGEPAEVNADTHAVVSWRTPTPAPSFALAGDLDGDGDDELLVPTLGEIRVWRGSGTLASPLECITSITTPIDVERLTAADFDGDGALDLVVAGSDGSLYLLAPG